jgi:hypothetical protein
MNVTENQDQHISLLNQLRMFNNLNTGSNSKKEEMKYLMKLGGSYWKCLLVQFRGLKLVAVKRMTIQVFRPLL